MAYRMLATGELFNPAPGNVIVYGVNQGAYGHFELPLSEVAEYQVGSGKPFAILQFIDQSQFQLRNDPAAYYESLPPVVAAPTPTPSPVSNSTSPTYNYTPPGGTISSYTPYVVGVPNINPTAPVSVTSATAPNTNVGPVSYAGSGAPNTNTAASTGSNPSHQGSATGTLDPSAGINIGGMQISPLMLVGGLAALAFFFKR